MSDCIYRTVEYVELHQGEVLGLRNSVISLAAKENIKHLPTISPKYLQTTPTPVSSVASKQDFPEPTKQQVVDPEQPKEEEVTKEVSTDGETNAVATEQVETKPENSVEQNSTAENSSNSIPPTSSSSTSIPPVPEKAAPQEPELERHACTLTPHDLCILFKSKSVTVPQQDSEMESYFHYCIGLDTSSPISISTYILKLLEKQQPPGWLEYYKYKVFKAYFCIYNFFSNCDVRVEFHFPGGVSTYLIDQDGKRKDEVTDQIWKEAAVSSFLRSLDFCSIQPLHHSSSSSVIYLSRCVKLLPYQEYLSLEQELSYLKFTIEYISTHITLVQSFQLATHIFNYLKSFGRITLALQLFGPLSQQDPSYMPFMAQLYALQKDGKESSAIWTKTSAIYSDNYIMILEYLKFSLEEYYKWKRSASSEEKSSPLLDTLQWCMDRLSKFEPRTIHAVCCEAKCNVLLGNYEKALELLQQIPKKSVELLVLKPFNFPKKISSETHPPLAEFTHPKWCDLELAERNFFFGNEQSGIDETVASKELEPLIVSVGTHSIFNDSIKNEMFTIFVQMYHLMGWDQFRKQWEQFKSKVNPVSETLQMLMDAFALDLKLLGKWTMEEDISATSPSALANSGNTEQQQYTAMDWFLRASLAQRLQLQNFSLLAFRKSVARADNTRSLVALLDLYGQKLVQNVSNFEKLDKTNPTYTKQTQEYHIMQDKLLVDILGFVEKLLGYYLSEKVCPIEDRDKESHKYLHVHPKCIQTLFKCVGVFGLQQVLKKIKSSPPFYREHLYTFLFMGVGWNITGFDS